MALLRSSRRYSKQQARRLTLGRTSHFSQPWEESAPPDVETDVNGRVIVRFLAGDSNGTATITATSGGASTGANGGIKIAVGTAAVGRVTISANPASVRFKRRFDHHCGRCLRHQRQRAEQCPCEFHHICRLAGECTGHHKRDRPCHDDLDDEPAGDRDWLRRCAGASHNDTDAPSTGGGATPTTPTTPTSSGQASGSVTVTISAVPTLVITPPATPPSAGLPAAFTFAVTVPAQNGSAVREVTVDWGDGDRQNLGAVTGNAVVSHVYDNAGTYAVTGTVTDASGNTSTVSTSVTVIPVPAPTVAHHVLTRPSKGECGDDLHDSGHGTGGHQRGQHGHRFRRRSVSEPGWAVGQFTADSTCLHVNWNVYGEGDCNGLDGTHDDWFDIGVGQSMMLAALCVCRFAAWVWGRTATQIANAAMRWWSCSSA